MMRRSLSILLALLLLAVFCAASFAGAHESMGKKGGNKKHKKNEHVYYYDNGAYHNGVYVIEPHPGKGWGAPAYKVKTMKTHYVPTPRTIVLQRNSLMYVRVISVIAGDVIKVSFGNGYAPQIVRLIGCDVPVIGSGYDDYYRREAYRYTTTTLRGKKIWLQVSGGNVWDGNSRILGYVWLSKPTRYDDPYVSRNLFNSVLVNRGYAVVSTKYPAGDRYGYYMTRYQDDARGHRRGLWKYHH